MNSSTYAGLKGQAYPMLATIASCDHPKAKSQGYENGWQMLIDKHDSNEMALFCTNLSSVLSEAQCVALLDGLAREFTQFNDWPSFADACADHPDWKPSQGPI